VTHQIQRAIDALQVSAGFRWKWYLQIASIVLSGIIAGIGVWRFGHCQDPWKQFFTTIGAAILGGFLAPVARDLVASLQQLRK
jgi:NO-binding membrane sensor protein with MHYT domain